MGVNWNTDSCANCRFNDRKRYYEPCNQCKGLSQWRKKNAIWKPGKDKFKEQNTERQRTLEKVGVYKMNISNLSIDDWIAIYETLNDDGHLSEDGIKQLSELTGRIK